MAQNITLLGANYADVPSVVLPKTGGGTAQFDDTTDATATAADIITGKTAYVNGQKLTGTNSGGGGAWSWRGQNAELCTTFTIEKTLAETDFSTWTPSTTAKVIIASATLGTYQLDYTQYDYVIDYIFDSSFTYNSSNNPHVERFVNAGGGMYFGCPKDLSELQSGNYTTTRYLSMNLGGWSVFYINSQGNRIMSTGGGYGPAYMTTQVTASVSSGGLLTLTHPNISARASNTYVSATTLGTVDQNASKFILRANVYRSVRGTSAGALAAMFVDTYNNPIV